MKHRLFAFLLVCAMAFSLAACTPGVAEPESTAAEVSVRVEVPVIGQTVADYLDSSVGVTVNGTALTRADSTDATYGGGTQFTAEVWCGYEVGWDSTEPGDVFTTRDPDFNELEYYGVHLAYAVPAKYKTVEYTFDTVGAAKYADETSDTLSEDGNWRIYDFVISFRPNDGIMCSEASISVRTPMVGRTVSRINEDCSVAIALSDTTGYDKRTFLTLTDSTGYTDPATYEDGTKFAVAWVGSTGEALDAGHVFADEDWGEDGCVTATVYYAVPAAYPVGYNVRNDANRGELTTQGIAAQTDEWIIRSVTFSFTSPATNPSVVITAPEIAIGETVAAANAGVHVTIDGVELTWIESELDGAGLAHYDPDSEFSTIWGFQDAGADGFTPMALNDVFTGDAGRTYVLWIYFSTPDTGEPLWGGWPEDPYDSTFVTADSTAFSVDHTATDYFHSDGTYWTDRADVYYVLHDHVFTDWVTTVEGSCTTATEKIRTCTVCGYEEGKIIEPEGHSWGDWVRTVKPTCTSEGARVRTCSRCGAQEAEKMAALGHSYTYTRTVGNYHTATCSRCGDTFEAACTYNGTSRCIYCGGDIIVY